MNPERVKKLSQQIEVLVRERDAELGAIDLAADLALETNVAEIKKHYDSRSWRDLQNVAAMLIQICTKRWTSQRSYEQAISEHAKVPPGIKMPTLWNSPHGSYLRAAAPIVISSASGVGKSTTARNIIVNNFLNKIPTVYVTNEDTMAESLIGLFTILVRIHSGKTYDFQQVESWLHSEANGANKYVDELRTFRRFTNTLKKYVQIIEAEYWSMSRIIFAAEMAENYFGEPAKCVILDYVQRIDPEPANRHKDVRLQMAEASRMWANFVKTKKLVGILISQLNDDGKTAESRQFEKDAGQWLVIERERDKDTEELSPVTTIRVKKGRRTGTGKMVCHFDGLSGAFIPSAIWSPTNENLYD